MSGTERQDVSDDYAQRISEGHFEVEAGVAMALQKLAGITGEVRATAVQQP
jgi:alpha-mannosidase